MGEWVVYLHDGVGKEVDALLLDVELDHAVPLGLWVGDGLWERWVGGWLSYSLLSLYVLGRKRRTRRFE